MKAYLLDPQRRHLALPRPVPRHVLALETSAVMVAVAAEPHTPSVVATRAQLSSTTPVEVRLIRQATHPERQLIPTTGTSMPSRMSRCAAARLAHAASKPSGHRPPSAISRRGARRKFTEVSK